MKKQRNYDKKVKLTRILLADYQLLKQFSISAGVSMAEALHELLIGLKPKAGPVAKPLAEPVPISVFFTPKSISDAVAFFKPKSVSGNGVAHIRLKSIKEV